MRRSYDFFSFFIIPALTFLLSAGYELSEISFSVIGNSEGRRWLFLLWGTVTGNYVYLYTKELTEFGECGDRLIKICLSLSFIFFLCGIGCPYFPRKTPLLAQMHIWTSLAGPVCLFVSLYRFVGLVEEKEKMNLTRERFFQLGTAFVSAVLYLEIGEVSGLLEMFVTFSTCIYLAALQYRLEKIRLSNR